MSGIDALLRQVAALADDAPPPDLAALHRAGDRRRLRRRLAAGTSIAAGVVAVLVAVAVVTGGGEARTTLPAVPDPRNGTLVVPGTGGELLALAPKGGSRVLVDGAADEVAVGAAWSPDGTELAFLRGRGDFGASGSPMWIFLAKADGSDVRRVARCPGACFWGDGGALVWSPSGDRLAVASAGNVYIVGLDTGAVRQLDVAGTARAPAWSPDGVWIAVSQGQSVVMVEADGTERHTVATGLASAERIDWSPDGRKLAVSGEAADVWVITLGAAGEVERSRVVDVVAQAPGEGPAAASFSPGGDRLVYFTTPRTSGGFTAELHTVATDGSQDTRIYAAGCCVSSWGAPTWSPDGRQVAMTLELDPPTLRGLVLVAATGGPGRVVDAPVGSSGPAWQPLPR